MKKNLLIIILLFTSIISNAQVAGNFNVGGDLDKFYPVTFFDGGWSNNVPTDLTLGRSSVHTNASWRGSLMATFKYHVTAWGNGSHFIDADVKPSIITTNILVAGWQDITASNSSRFIIIWLRGGGTTYYYQSNYAVNPVVYDGIQNALPYNITNGQPVTFKTVPDQYVITTGIYESRNAYFASNVGIGTTTTGIHKLAVEGSIGAREIKVQATGWSDFVFKKEYHLPTLEAVEKHIIEKGHLENIPSEEEVLKNGINLGEMNSKLLQKIEELTLYAIDQEKKTEKLSTYILELNKFILEQNKRLEKLEQ